MKDFIAKLEAAPEGSRELDARIHCIIHGSKFIKMWPGEDFFTEHKKGQQVAEESSNSQAHYTTSLDAKVPGENIIEVRLDGDKWWAWHQAKPGKNFIGNGRTEALARRIAGLKGLEND